jgi:hypothetical protein
MKTKHLLVFTIFAIIALIILILFLPFFNLTQSIGGGEYAQNTVYQIKSYNPLRPTILIIIPLSDEQAYFVVESEFTRTGINSLEPMTTQEEQDGFGSVDAKIYADSAQEAKQRYLDQQSGIKSNEQLQREEFNAELDKPIECRRLLEFENVNRSLKDFEFIRINSTFNSYFENISDKGLTYESKDVFHFSVRVDDSSEYEKIILYTEERPSSNLETKIIGIALQKSNCEITELEVDNDGSFIFP